MTVPDVTDPDLQSVAWELAPLLDEGAADPGAAVAGMVAEAQQRADAFAAAHAGKAAERRPRPRRRHARARGAPGAGSFDVVRRHLGIVLYGLRAEAPSTTLHS